MVGSTFLRQIDNGVTRFAVGWQFDRQGNLKLHTSDVASILEQNGQTQGLSRWIAHTVHAQHIGLCLHCRRQADQDGQ